MTFTNEDLKRFKECVCEMGVEKVTFFDFDLQSLFARLEAAEKCARWFDVINVEPKDSEPYRDYLEWRKARGL